MRPPCTDIPTRIHITEDEDDCNENPPASHRLRVMSDGRVLYDSTGTFAGVEFTYTFSR